MQETLFSRFKFRHNMYKLREERPMEPETFANLVSTMLYEKRFGPYFCQPVIAGLSAAGAPYLCGMDSIGAMETAKDFMVGGTAPESLIGVCESFWQPDMVRYALLARAWGLSVGCLLVVGAPARCGGEAN